MAFVVKAKEKLIIGADLGAPKYGVYCQPKGA